MKNTKFLLLGIISTLCVVGCSNNNSSNKGTSSKQREIEYYEDDGSEHAMPQNIYNNYGQDASSQLVVQWHNEVGSTNQRVQITTEDDTDFTYAHNVEGDRRNFSINKSTYGNYDDRDIFRAAIDNLEPGTKYIYRVGADGAWSDTYYHLTAEGENDTDFSFTMCSDPQDASHIEMEKTFTFANKYDPDHRFFYNCGDLVNYIGNKPEEMADYMEYASKFNKYKIIGATQGNHDTYYNEPGNNYRWGEATIFNAFIANPGNGFQEDPTKSNTYFYIYNGLLFISLNTMISEKSNGYGPMTEWLTNVLDTYATEVDYIVAAMHIGPFQSENDSEWAEPTVRDQLLPIFAQYKVDAVFYGHDHTYGRTNPLVLTGKETVNELKTFDTTPNPDGTVFSMVGATGPKFYELGSQSYQDNIFAARAVAKPGSFVNVKVEEDQLSITAWRMPAKTVSGKEVIDEDGEIEKIDEYTIAKKDR